MLGRAVVLLVYRWGNRHGGGPGGGAWKSLPKVRPDKGSCCYFHFFRQGNEGPERRFYVPKNVSSEVAGVESEPESLVTRGSGPSCPEVRNTETSVLGLASGWLGDLGQSI